MAKAKRAILNEYFRLEDAPRRQAELLNSLRREPYNMTLQEIADELGVTRQMVFYICKRKLYKQTARG